LAVTKRPRPKHEKKPSVVNNRLGNKAFATNIKTNFSTPLLSSSKNKAERKKTDLDEVL
jgi:hypothetical protein